jgi:hypothetical protein
MKTRIIHKYEGGKSFSAIAREFGFLVSAVNTFIKDATHIEELENFIFHLIHAFSTALYY